MSRFSGTPKKTVESLQNVKCCRTRFPADWSPEKVMEKIQESLSNPIKKPSRERDRWVYVGITTEKILITIIFDLAGELVTSYPML
ncbi:MAG TPA: EndoU domain-containing protein [Candidatus Babeliales bacterium]|nr:EndoU domain-containing protein [Candidatus Babeliales bacterium]